MKKNTYIEIELPWQIKLAIAGVAIATAAIAVALGCVIFKMIADNLIEVALAGIKGTAPFEFSFQAIWPLPLLTFGMLSLRFNATLQQAFIRRLEMF